MICLAADMSYMSKKQWLLAPCCPEMCAEMPSVSMWLAMRCAFGIWPGGLSTMLLGPDCRLLTRVS